VGELIFSRGPSRPFILPSEILTHHVPRHFESQMTNSHCFLRESVVSCRTSHGCRVKVEETSAAAPKERIALEINGRDKSR